MNPLYFYVLFAGGPVPDVTMSIEYISPQAFTTPQNQSNQRPEFVG
jgi:hypothetical protein